GLDGIRRGGVSAPHVSAFAGELGGGSGGVGGRNAYGGRFAASDDATKRVALARLGRLVGGGRRSGAAVRAARSARAAPADGSNSGSIAGKWVGRPRRGDSSAARPSGGSVARAQRALLAGRPRTGRDPGPAARAVRGGGVGDPPLPPEPV